MKSKHSGGDPKTHDKGKESTRKEIAKEIINIGRRSPAFPVTPPGVRVRTGRFGGLSYGWPVNLGIPSELK